MPNAPTAPAFGQAMDPVDVVDFELTISQGTDDGDLLQIGEGIASYSLTLSAEAVAAGLVIGSSGGRQPVLIGLALQFWLSIAAAQQSSTLFNGTGIEVSLELAVVTTSSPARTRRRSIIIQVANQ